MSLWFRTRDKNGTVHYVTVPFEPMISVAVVGIAVAVLLPFLAIFRSAVLTAPLLTSAGCVAILSAGFAMFAVAKTSVIRAGHPVSFGPGSMKRGMRWLCYLGYCAMVAGAVLVTLFVWAASTLR